MTKSNKKSPPLPNREDWDPDEWGNIGNDKSFTKSGVQLTWTKERKEANSKRTLQRHRDPNWKKANSKRVKKGIAEKRTNNQEYRDKIRKLNQAKAKNPKVRSYIKQRTLETQGMKVEVMDPQGNITVYLSTGEAARLLNWSTLSNNPNCWPKDGSWKEFKMREHKGWKTRRIIDK